MERRAVALLGAHRDHAAARHARAVQPVSCSSPLSSPPLSPPTCAQAHLASDCQRPRHHPLPRQHRPRFVREPTRRVGGLLVYKGGTGAEKRTAASASSRANTPALGLTMHAGDHGSGDVRGDAEHARWRSGRGCRTGHAGGAGCGSHRGQGGCRRRITRAREAAHRRTEQLPSCIDALSITPCTHTLSVAAPTRRLVVLGRGRVGKSVRRGGKGIRA